MILMVVSIALSACGGSTSDTKEAANLSKSIDENTKSIASEETVGVSDEDSIKDIKEDTAYEESYSKEDTREILLR